MGGCRRACSRRGCLLDAGPPSLLWASLSAKLQHPPLTRPEIISPGPSDACNGPTMPTEKLLSRTGESMAIKDAEVDDGPAAAATQSRKVLAHAIPYPVQTKLKRY